MFGGRRHVANCKSCVSFSTVPQPWAALRPSLSVMTWKSMMKCSCYIREGMDGRRRLGRDGCYMQASNPSRKVWVSGFWFWFAGWLACSQSLATVPTTSHQPTSSKKSRCFVAPPKTGQLPALHVAHRLTASPASAASRRATPHRRAQREKQSQERGASLVPAVPCRLLHMLRLLTALEFIVSMLSGRLPTHFLASRLRGCERARYLDTYPPSTPLSVVGSAYPSMAHSPLRHSLAHILPPAPTLK